MTPARADLETLFPPGLLAVALPDILKFLLSLGKSVYRLVALGLSQQRLSKTRWYRWKAPTNVVSLDLEIANHILENFKITKGLISCGNVRWRMRLKLGKKPGAAKSI